MIRNLRLRLAAFNTAVTGAILVSLTVLCLFVAEQNLKANAFSSFTMDLNTTCTYLGQSQRLSADWLRQLEGVGGTLLSIRDGEQPLFSQNLSQDHRDLAEQFVQAREWAAVHNRENLDNPNSTLTFPMRGSDGENYFAGLARVRKNGGQLDVIALRPLADMEAGIQRQRLVVAALVTVGLVLLGVFSWMFVGRLLRPILENQQRQAQFVASASHELRTPLTAILSAASAMERAEDSQRPVFGQMIRREGQRMGRLIQDMLTLASADSHSWELSLAPAEPDMMLLDVYEIFVPMAKEKGLSLRLELPDRDCPAVAMDRDRMEQVLTILLSNALSYTPSPGTVGLRLVLGRSWLRLAVWDTGPGVPNGEKQAIFQRFQRGETARTDRGHFGLGLCIAAEIVKLHRGKIWVEDGKEGGAVFWVELPITPAPKPSQEGEGGPA